MTQPRFNEADHPRAGTGRFTEKHQTDPGGSVLTDPGRPTVEDLQHTTHRADKVFTAIDRCIKPGLYESDRHYRLTLHDGYVHGTDGYIMVRARCAVADRCDNVGLDPAEARKAAAATKGELSPGLRFDDGRDPWLEIGGQPIHGQPALVSASAANRIVDEFQADWDYAAGPENWETTGSLLDRYGKATKDDFVQLGTSMYPARRLARAVKVARDLGVKQLLLQAQSHVPSGVTRGRLPLVKLTGPGVEIIVMGIRDRNV